MAAHGSTYSLRLMRVLAWGAALLCLLPIAAVMVAALTGGTGTVASLVETVLPRYAGTTAILVVLVATGTTMVGTGAAWLVTMLQFPGRRLFEIALALPMAFPAYVLAYAYTDFLDHPGWVQSTLRAVTGWGPRDYWFPEIRSLPGAALMLVLVLYPYVYLLSRAAFLQQSSTAYVAARSLGKGPWVAFFRVSLPIARPAIAGGVLLTIMETIADFGTVSYFGVPTFATGIYQSWFSFADRAAAAQLALCLLGFALLLAVLERRQRRHQRHHNAGRRFERMDPTALTGGHAVLAQIACGLPVLLGFALPAGLLISMGWSHMGALLTPRYLDFLQNSVMVAAVAAVLTVVAAVVLSFNARLHPSRPARLAVNIAGLGYAVPGGVIAVGLLVPFAGFDNLLDRWMRDHFDISTGLLLTGSIWVLVMAYMVRFMAAALSAHEAGLAMINPNIDAVARTLGRSPTAMLRGVHLPILRPNLLTALLIVFVDVMKELPATLIMRPFDFDTLAVQAHRLAADERLPEAAVPSLVIAAIGLIPVVVLCMGLGREDSTMRDHVPDPEPAE